MKNPECLQTISENSPVLKAEVIYAVREEMALKLSDVIRRRTVLGSAEIPSDAALESCAGLMAAELGWDADRISAEITETKMIYIAA